MQEPAAAMSVLVIGGEASYGEDVGNVMQLIADDMQSVVIPRTATGSPRTSVSRTHPG